MAKAKFVPEIDYVWVTFRNNLAPDAVMEKFEMVHPMTILCRKLLMIKIEKADEYDDQELNVTRTIEPDQIIWKNLDRSLADGGPRRFIVNFIALLVALVTMISTIYFSGQI